MHQNGVFLLTVSYSHQVYSLQNTSSDLSLLQFSPHLCHKKSQFSRKEILVDLHVFALVIYTIERMAEKEDERNEKRNR